ncbi:MAG: hypothetical protein ACRDST_17170 [Pseudonocardiaceae bacterium]
MRTRLPGTLAALEQGRITLTKARIIDAETLNLHTAAVEQQVPVKARRQTPGQPRAATRRALLATDPAAAQQRAERVRRERRVRMWPEPDGMAVHLPAGQLMPSGCSRCATSTRAKRVSPVMSAPWMPTAATPWSTWCCARVCGAVR